LREEADRNEQRDLPVHQVTGVVVV
jgi:hypothetical protein